MPRILDFAPLLVLEQFPLNDVIKALLKAAESALGAKVEIEFAVTIEQIPRERCRRAAGIPAGASDGRVGRSRGGQRRRPFGDERHRRLRHGDGQRRQDDIYDIVFVRPENFSPMQTPELRNELEAINRQLTSEHRPYLLIGFGRWGARIRRSAFPWTGARFPERARLSRPRCRR